MDFVRSAEFGRVAGGGQVRPQGLEPLVADDVGRILGARSAGPLPVGVPSPPPSRLRHRCTASWRCVCRCILIWCLWLVLSTIPGRKVSAADLATPATPTADAPTTVPIRPIVAPSMRRSFHPRARDNRATTHSVRPGEVEGDVDEHVLPSIWGHTPEGQTIIDKLTQFKTGAASLLHDEDVVPALAGAGIPDH